MSTATWTVQDDLLPIDLYCRISKDYDGTLRKVEDQEAQGRREVEAEGLTVGKVFRDHALSGWDRKVKRPDWDELMERLETGRSGGVWVRDLDRFTRKVDEAERLVTVAKDGARVLAGHSSYDFTTARGIKRFREDAVDAAYESDRISERTGNGKRDKAHRGRSNASRRGFARPGNLPIPHDLTVCHGKTKGCTCNARYADAQPVPAEQLAREQAAVREAVETLLAGGTLHAIAKTWNDTGLLTTNGYRWDGGMVRQMLVAPSIAGQVEHNGVIVGQSDEEPVIDPQQWERLMLHFASRKRGRPATEYVLSGLVHCGKCGALLYGRPQTHRQPYPDGQVRRQYWCMPREKQAAGCGRMVIDQRLADAEVAVMVVERLGDPRHADHVAKIAAKQDATRRRLQMELAQLNKEADDLASKYGTPGWTPARVDAALANYAPLIEEAQQALARLGEAPQVATPLADAQADWDDADVQGKRALVKRAFPEGLTVLPAKSRGVGAKKERRLQVGRP